MPFSSERWRFDLRTTLLWLFLLQSGLSTWLGLDPAYAWPFWIEFLKAVVITYLIAILTTDVTRFRIVLTVIALSLGFESAKQGWAQLITRPGGQNLNTSPMLGDNNGVAVGMMMLVPVLITLAATTPRWYERVAHRFIAFGVLYRGITTYSRGGFLACGALGLMYLLRSQRKASSLVALLVAGLLIGPVLPDRFWDRMNTIRTPDTLTEEDNSARGRLHFWRVATVMAADRPIFGVGHNSYNAVYDRYDSSGGEFGQNRSVHSVWFGLLAELGYPGLALFLLQLALVFGACFRARKAAAMNPKYADLRTFAFTLESAMVAFIVGGTFLPFQYTEMLWHFIGLSIALNFLAREAIDATRSAAPIRPGATLRVAGREAALAS
jgi:probable O-glycosylation ligase (exosortase A-associated)